MTVSGRARRLTAVIAALTIAVGALAAGIAASTATADAQSPATHAPARAARTTLVVEAPQCEGCTIELTQALWGRRQGDLPRVWDGPTRTVSEGVAVFRIPTRRTHGLSMMLRAPWEGATGYVTTVVMRYGAHTVGQRVTVRDARHRHRGSACWAGTSTRTTTLVLTTKRVLVPGQARGRVAGTLAFARRTQPWMAPVRQVRRGVMGSQDVNICGRHP